MSASVRTSRARARIANRFAVFLYRVLEGRLSTTRRSPILIITTTGRRTGLPRSTCVRYLDTDDGLLVWGSGSGSRHDPDWFENLRRTDRARVQIRDRHEDVHARELLDDERDQVWDHVVLARAPQVARYARKAGRTIPVARLTPVTDTTEVER